MIIANIFISQEGQALMFLDRYSMTTCVDIIYPYLLSTIFYRYMKTDKYVILRGYTQVVYLIGIWFNPLVKINLALPYELHNHLVLIMCLTIKGLRMNHNFIDQELGHIYFH
jgi:hypothetical protein